jgi:hypothetical protein
MTTLSRDTSPEAERVQIDLLRQASVARRFEAARRLTETTFALAVKAIRETMPPDTGDGEVLVRFVEIHHGVELAAKLARYLERRTG